MKKIFVIVLLISIMCTTACGSSKAKNSTNESSTNESSRNKTQSDDITINQKIVFIYHYSNWSDTQMEKGFYIDAKGNKVEYDITEAVYENRQQIRDFSDKYKIILEFAEGNEVAGEEFLSVEEVSKCYRLLTEISDDYEIKTKSAGSADMGSRCWYGVIDDGESEPKIILLTEEGDWESSNSHKNTQTILDILSN